MSSRLFAPLALRGLSLPNRIVISPMCQYSAVDGCATAWHDQHLGALAVSGAGMLILEATAVSPAGRISPADLGLWNEATEAALTRVVERIRSYAPAVRLCLQLAHAGRKASMPPPWRPTRHVPAGEGGWVPAAPSALAYAAGWGVPRALDAAGIEQVIEDFAATTRRAARIGFDAVEVHAAHGYLLHQFLSPLANRRSDEFGDSFENRTRLPLAVFDAVRAAFPAERPVGVRVSATDWVDSTPSWDLPQTVALAQALRSRGCDWIDVSSGGLAPEQVIAPAPGYQLPLARAVRATGITTMAVGLITEPAQAEVALEAGDADLVALGRAFLADPRWPWRAAAALGAQVAAPRQYLRALPAGAPAIFMPT